MKTAVIDENSINHGVSSGLLPFLHGFPLVSFWISDQKPAKKPYKTVKVVKRELFTRCSSDVINSQLFSDCSTPWAKPIETARVATERHPTTGRNTSQKKNGNKPRLNDDQEVAYFTGWAHIHRSPPMTQV